MNENFPKQFDALFAKYTELLLGESTPELQEQVKLWALYSQIAKSMPALAKHWNETYPEAKADMMHVIQNIKQLNDAHRIKK
ncbi:YusU family protein [Ectobacillus sp. JY-23]|uniref:YusU family protein n=1 Tax=Ectobacillus sp. JY-23 TaxID=2933872 RepID=UPI001FF5E543|nr:YusU family protein [Ectobacillus sp. JY-23]UOY91017.1 YusU family protein [Ectobacillus sp. JY-23]